MPFIIYRICLGILVLVLLATGVISDEAKAGSTTPVKPTSLSVPKDCLSTKVLSALKKDVRQAQFIEYAWEPAPGTELADFLNNGGIACTYGIQSAEVGISVDWVGDATSLFNNRVEGWISGGFQKIDIPNLSESEAYFFQKDQSPTNEFHQYRVNLLIDGFWISLGSSFGNTIEDSSEWLKAAVDSL